MSSLVIHRNPIWHNLDLAEVESTYKGGWSRGQDKSRDMHVPTLAPCPLTQPVPVPTLCANPDECVRGPVGSSSLSPGKDRAERKPRISPSTVCRSILRQCPVIQKEHLRVAAINPVNTSLALSYYQANDPVGRWPEQNIPLKPNSVICNLWLELMELTSKSFVCVCVGICLGVEWSCLLELLFSFFFVVVVIVLNKWTLK